MKQYILMIITALSTISAFSQEQKDAASMLIDDYFAVDSASVPPVLTLLAKKMYDAASLSDKTFVMGRVFSKYGVRLAFVKSGDNSELWTKNAKNEAVLLDAVDLNSLDLQRFYDKSSGQLIRNRWFLHYGGSAMFNADMLLSIALNFRIGFFLVKNRWDAGFSNSINMAEEAGNFNWAINSKYYFPMEFKKQRISPYLGAGVGLVNDFADEISRSDCTVLAGVSWRLGAGSLDAGMQYGSASRFMLTVGYTFFPWSSGR